MKAWLLAGIASVLAHPAYAGCKLPPPPRTSPSGATASREEMLAAQAALKTYSTEVAAYSACVNQEGGGDAELKQVIKQLEVLAAQFNSELRAFKQKNGGT
jgi:hypothetical protein